jgi:hypothetical protein
MYLTDVWALFDYWQQEPPTHVLVAGFVGYERKDAKPSAAKTEDLMPGVDKAAFGRGTPLAQMPAVIRDSVGKSPYFKRAMELAKKNA